MTRMGYVKDSAGDVHELLHVWVKDGAGTTHEVKAAWVKDSAGTVKQWWPPDSGTVPPHPGVPVVHTATAAATITSQRVSWHIPSSRHVKTQRLTITNTHGLHAAGRLNGHIYGLDPGRSFSITVSAGTRSVPITHSVAKVTRGSVRYTYTL